jgi:hypothetical protein
MGRRLLFVLGLGCAATGGWIVHHEGAINNACNASLTTSSPGTVVSAQCLGVVWPYAEGFALVIVGAILVFAGLMVTRRVMSGERQYMKDLKAGAYDRDNDHRHDYHLTRQRAPGVGGARGGAREVSFDDQAPPSTWDPSTWDQSS